MERERHIRFLEMMLDSVPSDYQEQEINRLTLAYFVISGLNILNAIEDDDVRIDKEQVCNWVLSFQVHPPPADSTTHSDPPATASVSGGMFCGFCGSRSIQFSSDDDSRHFTTTHKYNGAHLASTYCALAMLKTLGYNLDNLDSHSISVSMKTLQQRDGSFMPIQAGAEKDLRFVYCAAAICFMLNNWGGMDREKAKEYIIRCQSYDGGFGLVPGSESHGGATFCAVAALQLMGFIEDNILSATTPSTIINVSLLLEWCLQRQAVDGGFQGRSNKASDTCYAFWVGGVLRILGAYDLFDREALRAFLLTCQSKYGGFSKFPRHLPDLYHSYYGFSTFSLLEEPGLKQFSVALGIADIGSLGF